MRRRSGGAGIGVDSAELVALFAGHEDLDAGGNGHAGEEDFVHGLGDGQVNVQGVGEDSGAAGGFDTFGDGVHVLDDLGKGTTLSELYADVVVTGLGAAAGGDEVADAGEAAEGKGIGAGGDA